jgi:outer membrane protein OmpU
MNKLTKVGCSALCGSLAAVSAAHAGEMTVTGGVDMSWIAGDGTTTGNPIGIGSNLTFSGAGELDNGWTFGVTVANLNSNAYSSTAVNIDMLGLGKLNLNQGDSGNGIDALDDKMPTAWEEPWGAGLSTGIQLVSGVGPNSNVQYTTPTILGITIAAAVAPSMGQSDTADKSSGGVNAANKGKGYDLTVNLNPTLGTEVLSGLNLFAGGHYTEIGPTAASGNNGDTYYEGVAGITYDIGPVSIGGGRSGILTGNSQSSTAVDYYRNNMYGVAFNINDNLSVSYGLHESEQNFSNPAVGEAVTMEVSSYQLAYTMGGASVRIAESKVDNKDYQTTASADQSATTVSVSLAF